MPYEVLQNEVTVLKSVGEHVDPNTGKVLGHDHQSVTWFKGDIIPDSEISPVVVELYESGDAHTLSQLRQISDAKLAEREQARQILEEEVQPDSEPEEDVQVTQETKPKPAPKKVDPGLAAAEADADNG